MDVSDPSPKKVKRIKRGFTKRTDKGEKFTVYFEYFNEKIVKCHFMVGAKDTWSICDKEFIGIAKLDPRDSYNKDEGEKIALGKALEKYEIYTHKMVDKLIKSNFEKLGQTLNLIDSCKKKLLKIQDKNR